MADIENSGCLILWGYNPSFSRLTHATATVAALKRGMKLIVIDPRRAGLANKADIWLRVRPGTDGALALGLANIMIQRGWYDRDFIRDWSNGPHLVRADTGALLREHDLSPSGDPKRLVAWDTNAARPVAYDPATGRYDGPGEHLALDGEYRLTSPTGTLTCRPVFDHYAALCRQYSPEMVAATCWIPAAQLEETARLIWHARPVSYYAWSGHEHHANTTETARAMALLYALTGSFDAAGGNVLFPAVPSAPITGEDLPAAKHLAPAIGVADRPLGPARWNNVSAQDFYRAVLDGTPYPMRGLIGFGSNTAAGLLRPGAGRQALAALDFYAHVDLFMNPTAQLADIVLPVASSFEREALKIGFEISPEAQSLVQFRPAVVPPPGQARPDTDIIFDLAKRLGLGDQFWDGDIEAAYRHQLGPSGVSLEQLRARPEGMRVALHTRHAKHAEADAHGHPRGFPTPSRKVEFWSETFREAGYARAARLRRAANRAPGSARPGGALPAGADLCQADPVLPDPAPRLAQPAQARDGPGGGTAPARRRRARHRRRGLGACGNPGRRHARAGASERRSRSPRRRGRAWLVAGAATNSARPATTRSARTARISTSLSIPPRAIRSAAPPPTAPICARCGGCQRSDSADVMARGHGVALGAASASKTTPTSPRSSPTSESRQRVVRLRRRSAPRGVAPHPDLPMADA